MGDTEILPLRVQNVLDMEIVRLKLWSIKFNSTNIRLEGFVRNEEGTMMQKVCSENLVKRMNSTMLFDVSGRFYELSGQIDREYQQKLGMPSRIIDEFANGFPENYAILINSCLNSDQIRSIRRPIEAAPREPLRQKQEPIVTLANESEIQNPQKTKIVPSKSPKNSKILEKSIQEEEEEEEDPANFTLKVPISTNGDAITPIRFTRGNGRGMARTVFEQTPVRGKPSSSSGPLASSTPQPPPPPRRSSTTENRNPKTEQAPAPKPPQNPQYATDSDLFAVPKLPAPKQQAPPISLGFLDDIDDIFADAVINKTPRRGRIGRPTSPSKQDVTSDSRGRFYESRRDEMVDESRMSRKRGYYRSRSRSPDYDRRRRDHRDDHRYSDYYERDSRSDSKRPRQREESSSSGKSVRFERREDRHPDRRRHRSTSRESHRHRRRDDDYDVSRSRSRESRKNEKRKLQKIMKREKELMSRLQNSRRHSPSSSSSSSSSEGSDDEDEMAGEWERENQEIMDNSMMFGDGISRNRKRKSEGKKRKQPSRPKQIKSEAPVPAKKSAPKRNKRTPAETDFLNDSIASNRPRRACATPSTPAPKKITWPRRDLDRLKRVIELKKPSGKEEDWVEVARLLAKEDVKPMEVKEVAIGKLKWKEPVEKVQTEEEEEEEKKRRRGAAARIKEGVKMHEELQGGNPLKREDALKNRVEDVEEFQPEDVEADQSLLALTTPVALKKKGGTRASIMPKPVEDSPMSRGNNSTFANSPHFNQTKAKELETNYKYVQHLSMMHARPSSSAANKSQMNRTTTRGGSKNTSMSLEKGARKAMKMISEGRTIQEDSEEDDDDDKEEELEDDVFN